MSWIVLVFLGQSRILLLEALPVGSLPKGGHWESSGSGDNSEIEQTYVLSETEVYRRLTYSRTDRSVHKKTAYVTRGKLFNRNGYALRINLDGTVDGTTDKSNPQGKGFFGVPWGLFLKSFENLFEPEKPF